jgi:transposase
MRVRGEGDGSLLLGSFEVVTPRRSTTMTATTRQIETTAGTPALYVAFELGETSWKLALTTGMGQRSRERTIAARDRGAVLGEIERAKQRFGLSAKAAVRSCYEAGREGFWLHRWLVSEGIESQVVDASSIEVNRRARRAKTDRMDAVRLLVLLVRFFGGERRVWSVVQVPSVEEEDRRHLHRELLTMKRDRTRLANRIQGLLANQGLRVDWRRPLQRQLDALRCWDGSRLPQGLRGRLDQERERLELLNRQIQTLEATRRERIRSSHEEALGKVQQLLTLQGVGSNSAWLYVMEFFAWRKFRNRREVGALAGLTPTPYQSGVSSHEQGIAKAGNRHVRAMAIEIAWGWLRFQPHSALSHWYQERFGQGSSRLRRIGIVALARKLLIALWRFLESGVVPEGAELKTMARVRSEESTGEDKRAWEGEEDSEGWCEAPVVAAGFASRTDRWMGPSPRDFPSRLPANTGCGDRRQGAPTRIEGRPRPLPRPHTKSPARPPTQKRIDID